jgi:hypothetical protein
MELGVVVILTKRGCKRIAADGDEINAVGRRRIILRDVRFWSFAAKMDRSRLVHARFAPKATEMLRGRETT